MPIDIELDIKSIYEVVSPPIEFDNGSMLEHALWLTLRSNYNQIDYHSINPHTPDTTNIYYSIKTDKYSIESTKDGFLVNSKLISLSFDRTYWFLFLQLSNTSMMWNIRKNYKKLRNQFFKF